MFVCSVTLLILAEKQSTFQIWFLSGKTTKHWVQISLLSSCCNNKNKINKVYFGHSFPKRSSWRSEAFNVLVCVPFLCSKGESHFHPCPVNFAELGENETWQVHFPKLKNRAGFPGILSFRSMSPSLTYPECCDPNYN